jgi:hypothetical protein
MTANGSPGDRNGFQQWVDSLQRPAGATPSNPKPEAKDVTAPLVDESATHVHQIPKELIHRLRERETQGLLGVETERTAVFKPPPELLARAKRNQQAQKAAPAAAPQAPVHAEKTKPPPPEAAIPTVRPPPPGGVPTVAEPITAPPPPAPAAAARATSQRTSDDFADLEAGLEALKPIAPRAFVPRKTSGAPASAIARAPVSAPSSSGGARASSPGPAYLPGVTARGATPMGPFAALSMPSAAPSSSPASAPAPSSRPNGAPSSSRSGVVSVPPAAAKSGGSAHSPSPPPAADPDSLVVDEPTILRIVSPRVSRPSLLDDAPPAVRPELPTVIDDDPEPTGERLAGVSELEALDPAPLAGESLAPEAAEGGSGRRWVVIAALFCVLVAVALAWLGRR